MKTDPEMDRLEQVVEISKNLVSCADLSSDEEWERIKKYTYARFKISLP